MTAELQVGALLDAEGRRTADLQLPASDFTTHGVIVGMTGSGKTGLGIVLLEECARAGIATLVLDPKGDLTNLALRFPQLSAEEFLPWVNPARADDAGAGPGADRAALAAATADRWRAGLADWGLGPEDVAALCEAVDVTVYTPGSSAGVPLSLLGSLTPPALDWSVHEEALRDEIAGFVDGLLTLAGIDADPIASPEHVLLATIVEVAWRDGRSLDSAQLVAQVLTPPVRKLGVFDVDTFFPPADRKALALRLNGLLASPSASAWLAGAPADIGALLTTSDGRPRCAVVTLAHLSDAERQFAVAVLLSKVVTWMRTLPGTDSLRVLVYMDEVAGFVPPVAMPPAKRPILSILKTARAFGVGMVLSTQNPIDLDYRAIGNAGTWMIGRLQTERDRDRLLDGMSSAGGGVDLPALADTIGGLDKRQFVLHRAGGGAPQRFTTRWAMSYLRGPVTAAELQRLPGAAGSSSSVVTDPAAPADAVPGAELDGDTTPVAPAVADGVRVTYLDPAAPWARRVGAVPGGTRLEAALAFRISLAYRDARAGVDTTEEWEAVLHPLTAHPDPDAALAVDYDDRDLRTEAPEGALYALPAAPLDDARWFRELEKALVADVRADRPLEVQRNTALKLYARLGESPEEFAARCAAAATERADAEAAKLAGTIQARIDRKLAQLEAAERREAAAASDEAARHTQELISGAGTLLSVLLGGGSKSRRAARSVGGVASRRRSSTRAAQRREDAAAKARRYEEEIADLREQLEEEVDAIADRWQAIAGEIDSVTLRARAADVRVTDRAVVWVPVPASREQHPQPPPQA